MTDLDAATQRLHEAIERLENVLATEREAAGHLAANLSAAEEALVAKTTEMAAKSLAAWVHQHQHYHQYHHNGDHQ